MKPFSLSRRTVLRGAGIAIGLPTLDAMIDGRGRWYGLANAAVAPPVRVMTFHFPHGVVQNLWNPTATGANYTLTPALMPLADFQKDFNVITGLQQTAWNKGPGGGHANGVPDFATAVPSIGSGAGGPSVEQVLANEFGAATKYRALVANNEQAGTQTEGATSAHMNNISWTGPGVPAPSERDAMNFFMTLVSAVPGGAAPSADTMATIARKKSVLDHVLAEIGRLQPRVGSADKARLDQHTTSIREIERILQVNPAAASAGGECRSPDPIADPTMLVDMAAAPNGNEVKDGSPNTRPVGIAPAQARAQVFLRLFATAFRCDLTRYGSFAMSNGFDDRRAPEFGGGMVGHHQITHGGAGANGTAIEQKFVVFYVGLLAFLMNELKSTTEGAGTLLDNCLIYFGSEMSVGGHDNNNMPVVLAGRGGGAVVAGRHLAYPAPTPLAKLFLAMLKYAGSKTATFGLGGDAPLDGLSV